jgi:hypothetical protein
MLASRSARHVLVPPARHFARSWKIDPFSSGAVFAGWKELEESPFLWPLRPSYQPPTHLAAREGLAGAPPADLDA